MRFRTRPGDETVTEREDQPVEAIYVDAPGELPVRPSRPVPVPVPVAGSRDRRARRADHVVDRALARAL